MNDVTGYSSFLMTTSDRRADTLATLASRRSQARATIAESRFSRWANAIGAALVPSVRLHAVAGADVGRSRFGGEPMLPLGMPWPADAAGVPLVFRAQIDLAELTSVLGATPLPASGLLVFFEARRSGRVVHLPASSAIGPRTAPDGASRHRQC